MEDWRSCGEYVNWLRPSLEAPYLCGIEITRGPGKEYSQMIKRNSVGSCGKKENGLRSWKAPGAMDSSTFCGTVCAWQGCCGVLERRLYIGVRAWLEVGMDRC